MYKLPFVIKLLIDNFNTDWFKILSISGHLSLYLFGFMRFLMVFQPSSSNFLFRYNIQVYFHLIGHFLKSNLQFFNIHYFHLNQLYIFITIVCCVTIKCVIFKNFMLFFKYIFISYIISKFNIFKCVIV